MGFFDSTNTQDTTMNYDNPELRDYTAGYRGAAPWGFASLDPTAALAAMGRGTRIGGRNLGADYKAYLEGLSGDEKKQAQTSREAMMRIVERQKSGNFLTPEETNFINTSLDKAFESSRNIAMKDWTMGAQSLAGGRGMRTSDTPVAQPAMNALRDMELGFSSQRADKGLNATMGMSAQQNQFDAGLMDSLNSLQFNRWNARQGYLFGGGLSAAANMGYTTNTHSSMTQGMSGFGQFMGGLSMANGVMGFAKNVGGSMMGMPGGGGGAPASGFGFGGNNAGNYGMA